jgi:hypothetical protein
MTEPAAETPKAPAMTVPGAIFLGVGSMVGAGIFALLGEAGTVAGAAVWMSFALRDSDPERAATLLGAVRAWRAKSGLHVPDEEREAAGELVRTLGQERFDALADAPPPGPLCGLIPDAVAGAYAPERG